MKKKFLLIVAGGSGLRMGSEIPKQFIEIAELPILMHTVNAFSQFEIEKTIIILPQEWFGFWRELVEKYQFKRNHEIVAGGSERFFSVKNGLAAIPDNGIVAIHDGVRPLVSEQTINNCFELAATKNAAIPVINLTDSIRKIKSAGSIALNRNDFKLVQTPQVFNISMLKEAYAQGFSANFTDDASVFESKGFPIYLCAGNEENLKITRKQDLLLAELMLKKSVK